MKIQHIVMVIGLMAFEVHADSSTLDAAVGGGIGGAAGAAIGNEVGGRDAAIVGSALGAAIGTAINTDEQHYHSGSHDQPDFRDVRYYDRREYDQPSNYRFCPPGQAKKGHC
jgi:phage tail tape-measure protein